MHTNDNNGNEIIYEDCKINSLIQIISGKWTVRIIYLLGENNGLRFGQMRRALSKKISPKSLSEQLKKMHAEDLVDRRDLSGDAMEVHYRLTPKGMCVHTALKKLEADLIANNAL